MEQTTKVFIEVLDFLRKAHKQSNNAIYHQLGWSESKGKKTKSGELEVTVVDLCQLVSYYPELAPMLQDRGIDCPEEPPLQEKLKAVKRALRLLQDDIEKISKSL